MVAKQMKETGDNEGRVYTLGTGVKVKLHPVSSYTIEMIRSSIVDPKVPTYMRDETPVENPGDPQYVADLRKAEEERTRSVAEAVLVLGVELVDPVPPPETWLKKVKYLDKRYKANIMDRFDVSDPDDLDLLYKLTIAVGGQDWRTIGVGCGTMMEEEIVAEMDKFRGDEEGSTDTPSGAQ